MDYTLGRADILDKVFAKINYLFVPSQSNDYRPKFLQSDILAWFILFLLLAKVFSFGAFTIPQNMLFADLTKVELMTLVNRTRTGAGLPELAESEKLNQAARLKAQDMVQKGYFAHYSPEGLSPWFWFRQAGYNYKYAGENLAVGFVNSEDAFSAWYASKAHRDNLLSPYYDQIGTAILEGFHGYTVIVVQLFGKSQGEQAVVDVQETVEVTQGAPEENQALDTNGKLSEITASGADRIIPAVAGEQRGGSFYPNLVNFLVYDYDKILTYISFTLLIVVAIALFFNIFIKFQIQHHDLIFRGISFMIILSFVALADNHLVSQAIPHQILI